MVTLSPLLLLWSTKAVTPEPTNAPTTAAITATATQRRPFFSLGSVVAIGAVGGGGKPAVVAEPNGGVAGPGGAAGAVTGNGHPGWAGGGGGGAAVTFSTEVPTPEGSSASSTGPVAGDSTVGLPDASMGAAAASRAHIGGVIWLGSRCRARWFYVISHQSPPERARVATPAPSAAIFGRRPRRVAMIRDAGTG